LNLKQVRFKILLKLLFLLLHQNSVHSQEPSVPVTEEESRLMPDFVNLQFAGGSGFLSAGVGYAFVNKRIDLSLNYGYVPAFVSSDVFHMLSFKLGAKLLRFKVGENLELFPLNLGILIHHHIGREFWIKLPAHYRYNYYWWSPGLSPGIFWNIEVKTNLLANRTLSSGTAFYAHLGTRELYMVSKYGNSTLPFNEIVEFGIGIKVYR
jgi:hypothetical protein